MEQVNQATSDSRVSIAPREPQHLHFDRRSRAWMVHADDGSLRPYAGVSANPSSDPSQRRRTAA